MQICRYYAAVMALGIFAAFVTTPTYAVPVTYTEQTMASGFLDGTSFSDATVTFTALNDTGNVGGAPPFSFVTGAAEVNVDGIGTDTFSAPLTVFARSFSGVPLCGFGASGITILGTVDGVCATTIDLKSDASVVSGAISSLGSPIATLGGYLVLTSTPGSSTFTVTVDTTSAIPEPPSISLCLMGLCALAFAIGPSRQRAGDGCRCHSEDLHTGNQPRRQS